MLNFVFVKQNYYVMEKQNTCQGMVSVITPMYNVEQYLAETLDAVLASEYKNIEIVLMDDGSADQSLAIAQRYARQDSRVRVFSQANAGACAARNNAIAHARGQYILPVDGDDLISPTFIGRAVGVLASRPEVKVVYAHARFIGDRTGEWRLPPFSLGLLARKNMIPISALYRKQDWERVGGYCQEIIAREDWEFWISVLKDGGAVVRLPETGLLYRIRANSKRTADRALKHHVVDTLNKRHADFFQRQLGGPLRYHRSWSRVLNCLAKLCP